MNFDLLYHLLEDSDEYYSGKVLETGGTSTNFAGLAPGLQILINNKMITPDQMIIDYGAGKYARNADALRNKGFRVWAYDPYNHNSKEGFALGNVSDSLPHGVQFDVVLTAFVLNVVPKYTEDQILQETKTLAPQQFHLVRHMDIFDSVKKALLRQDKTITQFFQREFLHQSNIEKFCKFGVQTSRGFQRIPALEGDGYKLVKKTRDYKLYSN